ncbi:hypothetical protein NDN08_001300 [Rhodosorus marinus]|uniref:Uncharacterized protein n=1 Tax=Rhodosorus marinus TaxID=101924 RepID=A0AAV8UQG1_9RHOD|nr:hypothetical protein NDN08_001300 [Rhodosorus marinus]
MAGVEDGENSRARRTESLVCTDCSGVRACLRMEVDMENCGRKLMEMESLASSRPRSDSYLSGNYSNSQRTEPWTDACSPKGRSPRGTNIQVQSELRRLRRENERLVAKLAALEAESRELIEKAGASEGAAIDASMEVLSLKSETSRLGLELIDYEHKVSELLAMNSLYKTQLQAQLQQPVSIACCAEHEPNRKLHLIRINHAVVSITSIAFLVFAYLK